MIKKNPKMTIAEMAVRLGISDRTVKKYLANLQKEGRITRVGPTKGGSWHTKE
jgi:ATP-dependent DNA helicase RecG